MSHNKVTRRRFLRGLAAVAGGTVLAACTPQVVEKVVDRPVIQTVVVDRAVEVERVSTVIVEKAVEVEKRVVETVVVDRPVQVEKRVVETVVVDRPVQVEKRVVETVIVDREVVVEKEVAAPVEPVEVSLLCYYSGSWEAMNSAFFASFKEATGHTVTPVPAQGNAGDEFVAYVAAGNPPDMLHWYGPYMGPMYAGGMTLPLDDILAESKYNPDEFQGGDLGCTNFRGKQYGLPLLPQWGTYYGFYLKQVFDEAGLPVPDEENSFDSWDDLYEVARQLTKKDASGKVTRWGLDAAMWWSGYYLLSAIKELGGNWFDSENKVFTLDTDEVAEAIQTRYLDPVFTHGVYWDEVNDPDPENGDYHSPYASPWSGIVAMTPWIYSGGHPKQSQQMELWDGVTAGMFANPSMAPGASQMETMVIDGTWSIHITNKVSPMKIGAMAQYVTWQYEPENELTAWQTMNWPSARKAFWFESAMADSAVGDPGAELTLRALQATAAREVVHCGWEWGRIDMMDYLRGRCGGDAGEARCAETGIWNSGNVTAEQLAEEWQEQATLERDKFLDAAGITDI